MVLCIDSENHKEPVLLLILVDGCLKRIIWHNALLLIEQYINYRSIGLHSDSPFLKILFVGLSYHKKIDLSLNCWYKFHFFKKL